MAPVEITAEDREMVVDELKSALPKYRQPFSTFLIWNEAGEVWIPLVVREGAGRLYDVVDASGAIRQRVRLRPGQRVVGLTKTIVFVGTTDDDGFEWLSAFKHW